MFDLMQYALIFYDFQLILAQMALPPQLMTREVPEKAMIAIFSGPALVCRESSR